MGRRLISKSYRSNGSGEMLVSFAADRAGGIQVGGAEVSDEGCVPFSVDPTLSDRKFIVMCFPTALVNIGRSPVILTTAYFNVGLDRGDAWQAPPKVENYSNPKQVLRGQYSHFALQSAVQVCLKSPAVEDVTSTETS